MKMNILINIIKNILDEHKKIKRINPPYELISFIEYCLKQIINISSNISNAKNDQPIIGKIKTILKTISDNNGFKHEEVNNDLITSL